MTKTFGILAENWNFEIAAARNAFDIGADKGIASGGAGRQ
jgi:hypothetical protein